MSSESISNLDAFVIRKEIAVAALGGYIYAMAGYGYNVNYRLVERAGAVAVVVNVFIYVIGRFDGNNCLNTVEK